MVVEKTDENLCQDSMELMLGILHGCCVVGMDWVTASLERNQLLPTDDFEPHGTIDYPNTNVFQRARLNKEQLVSDFAVIETLRKRLNGHCHDLKTSNQRIR